MRLCARLYGSGRPLLAMGEDAAFDVTGEPFVPTKFNGDDSYAAPVQSYELTN